MSTYKWELSRSSDECLVRSILMFKVNPTGVWVQRMMSCLYSLIPRLPSTALPAATKTLSQPV